MSYRLIVSAGCIAIAVASLPIRAQDIDSNYLIQSKLGPAQTLDTPNLFTSRIESTYSGAQDNRLNGRGKAQGLDTTATFLVTPNQWISVGAGLNYGVGGKDFAPGQDSAGAVVLGGSSHTSALVAFALATVNFSPQLSASFIGGYGKFTTNETLEYTTSRLSWTEDGETRLFGAGLSYKQSWNNFFIVPSVQVAYTEVNYQDYKATQRDKATGAESTVLGLGYRDDQTRGRIGSTVGYVFQDGSAKIVPTVSAYWVHYLDMYRGFWDRDGVDLAASLTYVDGPLSVGAEIKTSVGFQDFSIYSTRAYLNYSFGDKVPVAPSPLASKKLEADIDIGPMRGLAREYHLATLTGQVSSLDWHLNNIIMVSPGLSYRPIDWLTLKAKVSTNVTGAANQRDDDFDLGGCPALHCVSFSPNTIVNHAWRVDASARARVLASGPLSLEAIAGYRWETYQWQSFGGVSNYIPVFDNGLQITYDQTWDAPYIGLAASGRFGPLRLSAQVTGSNWGTEYSRDHHHIGGVIYTSSVKNVHMLSYETSASYQLTDWTKIALTYGNERWFRGKGPEEDLLLLPGAIPSAGNIGGASLATQTVSLGVTLDLSQPSAANRPSSRTSPAVAAPAWSGFHVVAEAGGVWRDMIWTSLEALGGPPPFPSGAKAPVAASDPRAGGAVGYDWRFGSLLFGVDVEVGKSAPVKTIRGLPGVTHPFFLPFSSDSIVLDPSWEISPRARAGVLLSPSILAYATGGYAWQQFGVRASCTASFLWCSFDHYHSTTRWLSGLTAGAGLEVALDHGVFVRGEYSYVRMQDFGITIFPEAPLDAVGANVKTASSRASLGLGLRF